MIQQLASYSQMIAALFFTVCFNGMVLPTRSMTLSKGNSLTCYPGYEVSKSYNRGLDNSLLAPSIKKNGGRENNNSLNRDILKLNKRNKRFIGGPSQPEMSAFKSAGTDNLVNLFTGDFSYNIPLLDVGGYPVNIFYDGGVGMEQEASWVGLGWNINPGNVNRNMRGIPDDFNGEDLLVQTQNVKPNTTWGVTLGADFELVGIKNPFSGSVGASLGISFNNYLGPALDIGIRGNTGLSILGKSLAEKGALSLGGSLSINAGSRTGVTFSPGVSLTANCFKSAQGLSTGFGLKAGTSYNSRTGIKAMQISEQMNFNYNGVEKNSGETRTSGTSTNLIASYISFTKPSYLPSMRMPVTNSAYSGHFQVGSGLFGLYPSLEVEVYKQKSEIAQADQTQTKPLVGYLYLQKANNNTNAVMDFTRFNDNEVTPSTPVISAPQYSYDVFTIQGEGTGGSIRAYRNEEGYVRDNSTLSKDRNISVGGDIGPIGHFGGNFNVIKTPSTIGEWNAGNKLRTVIGFKDAGNGFENVYFRNPGEASVVNASQYDRIGGADLVRYRLGGTNESPTLEPLLERFSKKGEFLGMVNLPLITPLAERKKRTQVISFLTAEEATIAGLDKTIKSYDGVNVLVNQRLNFQSFPRFDGLTRKKHHISQINVTEANGQRYVYGIPVYNISQKDFTFTVNNTESVSDPGKVDFAQGEATTLNTGLKDGYIQTTTTPAFAHSFLLSGLLSPDYVDLGGDGITEDDLGTAIKFNYTKIAGSSKWRTPLANGTQANFIPGKRSETRDDKGVVSYGERESWYLHSIESKTLIALFKLGNRHDGKGSTGELSGVNPSDNASQRLQQIDLYNKADLKLNGLQGARPIKTVHFEYSYALCKNVPNNPTVSEGKLTLDKIYFTYNGQNRANKNQYLFSYGTMAADNPGYIFNASDRWGSYKNSSSNPQSMPNADYPYSIQDKNKKALIDQNAAAWMLKKILLPSGGQMEMTYESDDYAFVQNKRATDMMQVVGFGNTSAAYTNQLYGVDGNSIADYNYAFIQIPESCALAEVYKRYLDGIQQLSFRLAVIMPNGGEEYINSYATFDQANCGLYTPDVSNKTIWIKLNPVDGISPLSLTAIEYLREQLPGQAYPGYDVSDNSTMAQVGEMFKGWWAGIKSAFTDPVAYLRSNGKAEFVNLSKCFVRLNDHDGYKYGGGYRVKSIRLKDNWQAMNPGQLYTSTYGQDYDYTTKETFNGSVRTISSGVASYEPSLGGDENPFQTMVQVSNKVPLGPASYGAIEMPVLDAFFPAPSVGYSKVTVTSIKKNVDVTKKSRSGIGKQITEFYTAKDYPVFYSNTSFDPNSDKQANSSSFNLFFYKYAFDSRALSQGFLVETNDMHGKIKSQASYPENDDKAPVNYAQYFYRNTGSNALNEKFDFVYASQGGVVSQGNMGIDIELMTDTREFCVKSRSYEVQGQTDLFPIFGGWYPFIWQVAGAGENRYRAVTTTKVISYHSILDSIVVIDKGSQVGTRNLVYDAETGDVIVSRTNNEFKQPVYTTNYPAWWAYSGMGPAYKNIDVLYSGVNFRDGRITNSNVPISSFESGDELYLMNQGNPSTDACAPVFNNSPATMLWAFDITKNNSSLTNPSPSFVFMDDKGRLYSKNNVQFRIIRSGKRNVLDAKAGSVVTMKSPVVQIDVNTAKLKIDINSKTINASAAEYKEKWQTDNEVIKKFSIVYSTTDCSTTEIADCVNGYLEKNINPYCKGLLGNFRAYQSKVFYDARGDASENNIVPPILTNLPANGLLPNFKLYWDFNSINNLVPDIANTAQWVWNTQVMKINARGLELETKDALGIFTAAQYGFGNTIPVAIVKNARLNEMMVEGFEDNSYDETVNGAVSNPCLKKHIDFANMAGSSIVNVDNLGLNAHSGKYALSVNANSAPKKILPVTTVVADQFQLDMLDNTQKDLFDLGGLLAADDAHMLNDPLNAPALTTTNFGMSLNFGSHNVIGDVNGSVVRYFLSYKTTQYTKISTSNNYTFTLSTNQSDVALGYPPAYLFNKSTIIITIKRLDNTQVASFAVHSDLSPQTLSVFLNCDTYLVECYCSLDIQRAYNGTNNFHAFGGSCSYTSNTGTISYRSLSTQNNCTYTKPIPATDLMLNSIFSIPANKKMLFSAWVKQPASAAGIKSTIVFSDGSGKDFLPTGPVIEGWQKIEGDFIAPATAASATLSFVNNSNVTVYYDDIRMHPYNANMKSYVYDAVNLRLLAELDANNYGSFYEYNEEGTLVRTKAETKEGIKTIKEIRTATQKNITTFQ